MVAFYAIDIFAELCMSVSVVCFFVALRTVLLWKGKHHNRSVLTRGARAAKVAVYACFADLFASIVSGCIAVKNDPLLDDPCVFALVLVSLHALFLPMFACLIRWEMKDIFALKHPE